MTRTPNRGVVVAGAALSSVSIAVGVLGASVAQASPQQVLPPAPAAPQVSTATAQVSAQRQADDEQVGGAIARQAAKVAAAAAATKPSHAKKAKKPNKPKKGKKKTPAKHKASRPKKLTPRQVAQALVAKHGWSDHQFNCLNLLWTRESGWQVHNRNGYSGAYGIPQSLPGRKMASAGSDWRDNPMTQIRWGLSYIADRYSTPCGAWAHSERYNYY